MTVRLAVPFAACLLLGSACTDSTGASGSPAAAATTDVGVSDAAPADAAKGTDAATPDATAASLATPPAGEHFCLAETNPALVWQLGTEKACTTTAADTPPMTADQVKAADYACTFWGPGPKVVPACPPKSEALAFCKVTVSPLAKYKQWRLIYKSKIQPDLDAISLNPLANSCLPFDITGKEIKARPCTGKLTLKVDGKDKDFGTKMTCMYKSDGVKAQYFIEGNTNSAGPGFDRIHMVVLQENGKVTWGADASNAAGFGYLEGGSNPFIYPKDPATAKQLATTKFADKGGGVTGTFAPGEFKNGGGVVRNLTDGVVDVQIAPFQP